MKTIYIFKKKHTDSTSRNVTRVTTLGMSEAGKWDWRNSILQPCCINKRKVKLFLWFLTWTSGWAKETKELYFKREGLVIIWRQQSPNKRFSIRKCFVHPLVDYRLQVIFKKLDDPRWGHSLQKVQLKSQLTKEGNFFGSLMYLLKYDVGSNYKVTLT